MGGPSRKKMAQMKKAALEAPLFIIGSGISLGVSGIRFGVRRRGVLLPGDFRTCPPPTARAQMKPRFRVGVALRRVELGRLVADCWLVAQTGGLGFRRAGGDGDRRCGGSRGDPRWSGDESRQARRDRVEIHAGLFLRRRGRRIEPGLLIAEVLPALTLLIETAVIARLAFLPLLPLPVLV